MESRIFFLVGTFFSWVSSGFHGKTVLPLSLEPLGAEEAPGGGQAAEVGAIESTARGRWPRGLAGSVGKPVDLT